MGRKKGSKNRKGSTKSKRRTKKNQSTAPKISIELIGGCLVLIAIVLYVFITFDNAGVVGTSINTFLTGMFGIIKYAVPIIIAYLGIMFIISEEISVIGKIVQSILFVALISSTIYTWTSTNYGTGTEYNEAVYAGAIAGENLGGLVGAKIASFLNAYFGLVASRIVLLVVTIFNILAMMGITIKDVAVSMTGLFSFLFVRVREDLDKNIKDIKEKQEVKKAVDKSVSKEEKIAEDKKIKDEKLRIVGVPAEKIEENLEVKRNADVEQIGINLDKMEKTAQELEREQNKQQRDEFFKKTLEKKEDKNIKEVLQLEHITHVEESDYKLPSIEFLTDNPNKNVVQDTKSMNATALRLKKTLESFGVTVTVTNISRGPRVTRYELTPSTGVRVNKIVNLTDDIALSLAAKTIRIEAPIPGKAAVGIEVPNEVADSVFLREIIEHENFKKHKSKLAFALGKDATGDYIVGDIAKFPHVLIAGSTGSGKSVCINTLITSILYNAKPSEVRLILVDPKMVELSGYNGIPHLLIPVVIDPKKAAGALNWAVNEMENRYMLFANKGTKDIKGYNEIIERENKENKNSENKVVIEKLPQIVIIIDELADLMMVAPKDVEDAICRLAQKARASGMHLVIATQRPSVDVITGIIKANIPSRIAFTVSSQIDSRTILDTSGAEKLLGKGDMLYCPNGENKPLRIQGCFVSENEIEKIVTDIKTRTSATYSDEIIQSIEKSAIGNDKNNNSSSQQDDGKDKDEDEFLTEAIDLIISKGSASASMLQRAFKVGYSRAGRMIDQMEARGIISGYEGSKPRQVLMTKEEWQELKMYENQDTKVENEEA